MKKQTLKERRVALSKIKSVLNNMEIGNVDITFSYGSSVITYRVYGTPKNNPRMQLVEIVLGMTTPIETKAGRIGAIGIAVEDDGVISIPADAFEIYNTGVSIKAKWDVTKKDKLLDEIFEDNFLAGFAIKMKKYLKLSYKKLSIQYGETKDLYPKKANVFRIEMSKVYFKKTLVSSLIETIIIMSSLGSKLVGKK